MNDRCSNQPACNHCYSGNVPFKNNNGYWWHEFLNDEQEPCKDPQMDDQKAEQLRQCVETWESFDRKVIAKGSHEG